MGVKVVDDNAEIIADYRDSMWYHVGRKSAFDEFAHRLLKEAGDCFKRGADNTAMLYRELSTELKALANEELDHKAKYKTKYDAAVHDALMAKEKASESNT